MFNFDPERGHVTLLGLMGEAGSVRLPAVLSFPNQGVLRITGMPLAALGYDAARGDPDEANFVTVTFPPATVDQPRLEYRFEVTAIYPSLRGIDGDRRFDGFRRNWLNIIQLNPRFRGWPTTRRATRLRCAITNMPTLPGTPRRWPTASRPWNWSARAWTGCWRACRPTACRATLRLTADERTIRKPRSTPIRPC